MSRQWNADYAAKDPENRLLWRMGGRGGGGSTTGAGGPKAPGSLMSFLHYTQTQESAADQAAMSYLQRTGQSPKGTIDFLKILQKEERLQINRRDPYLTTHPLTPERISAFEQAAAQSPYVNTPDTQQNLNMADENARHHNMNGVTGLPLSMVSRTRRSATQEQPTPASRLATVPEPTTVPASR